MDRQIDSKQVVSGQIDRKWLDIQKDKKEIDGKIDREIESRQRDRQIVSR